MFSLIKIIIVLAVISALLGVARTWQMEHSAEQKIFVGGKVPALAPDGFYAGNVGSYKVSWLGKKFNPANSSGINVLRAGSSTVEKYPFNTSSGIGLRDTGLMVMKIDYNIASSPFWLRLILDEIVEINPRHYLGKMHLRLIPGYPFTLVFFELKK